MKSRSRSASGFFAVVAAAAAQACSSTSAPSPAPVAVTVAPTPAKVLTCSSSTFTATVTGASDASVAWSVTPAGVGTIDATGKYIAPSATPTPAAASVTATPQADPTKSGSASLVLATAFPGIATPLADTTGTTDLEPSMGVYPHTFAAHGKRAYGVWPANPAGSNVSVMISRSDDGGATWGAPVAALSAVLKVADTGRMSCPAVTIDPVDPDVVYVVGHVTASSSLATSVGADDLTVALAVSKDGGKTWATRVLHVGGGDTCPDLTAPAKGTVVVESPHQQNCDGNPDMLVWSDAANGDGFAAAAVAPPWARPGEYIAAGLTGSLDNVSGMACGQGRVDIGQNGTSGSGGEVTEAPRLFSNGKGRTCITYVGTVNLDGNPHPPTQTNTYLQCSDDAGATFSAPIILDPAAPAADDHSSAIGAFGPGNTVAAVWESSPDVAKSLPVVPYIALSKDGGKTFGAPALIPTYVIAGDPPNGGPPGTPTVNPTIAFDASGILWFTYRGNDGGPDRILVDKSCDGGKTWSGAVLVNGPEGSVANMKWPTFVMSDGPAPRLIASGGTSLVSFALAP